MSDVSLPMKLKEFEIRITALESQKPKEIAKESDSGIEERLRSLENKYRMMNARMSRKQE
jgi:hypothetical protein